MIIRIWKLFCSLKLAITLASLATLATIIGSLISHYHPQIFATMDQQHLSEWLRGAWQRAPLLSSWVPLTGLLIILLGVNTFCCFLDWAVHLQQRWRKTGEYLLHLGFVLVLTAFIWGSLAGFRSSGHQLLPGKTLDIPEMPGYSLRLNHFAPQLSKSGQPLDMVNDLTLLFQGEELLADVVSINHPLMRDGLTIIATSMGQSLTGFKFFLPGQGIIPLTAGSRLPLTKGFTLAVKSIHPHVVKDADGTISPSGDRIGNPAMEIVLERQGQTVWKGWYSLREGLPAPLAKAGAWLRPVEPLYRFYTILTINRDPGIGLATVGGTFMLIGVMLAMISFYAKRRRGDRPEVL